MTLVPVVPSKVFNLIQQDEDILMLDTRSKADFGKGHIRRSVCVKVISTSNGDSLGELVGPGAPIWTKDCWWDRKVLAVVSYEEEKAITRVKPSERSKTEPIISKRWQTDELEEEPNKRRKLNRNNVIEFLIKEGLVRNLMVLVGDKELEPSTSGYDQFAEDYPFLVTKHTKGPLIPCYPSEIIPRFLYLGDWENAKSVSQLKDLKITHIVTAHTEELPEHQGKIKFKKIHFSLSDEFDADISQYFPKCNSYLKNCQEKGFRVLVHCGAGASRSATLCAAFLIKEKKWGAQKTVKYLHGLRKKVQPNEGFLKALEKYQRELGIEDEAEAGDKTKQNGENPRELIKGLRLEVWKDGNQVDEISLLGKPSFVIGRLNTCDIVLEHASISRQHAKLVHSEGSKPSIEDLKASHGTKVNGSLIGQGKSKELEEGDEIIFGASTRKYILRGIQAANKWDGEADVL